MRRPSSILAALLAIAGVGVARPAVALAGSGPADASADAVTSEGDEPAEAATVEDAPAEPAEPADVAIPGDALANPDSAADPEAAPTDAAADEDPRPPAQADPEALRGAVARSSLVIERPKPPRDNSDRMLVVGGGVLTGVGAALVVPMTVGLVVRAQAQNALDRLDTASEASERPPLEDRKQLMTRLAIGTGIAAAAYLTTGFALLGLGLRGHRSTPRATAVSPVFGRAMAGVSLQTRF